MTNLDQFPTKAAGMPEFEIQGMFSQLSASHEPAGGLNIGMGADMGFDDFTNG